MFLKVSLKLKIFIFIFSLFIYSCQKNPSLSVRNNSLEEFSQNYKELTVYYDNLLKNKPNDLNLKLKVAKFYYKFKDYQKVKEIVEHIDKSSARVILAKALAKLNDDDHAIEVFEQEKKLPQDQEYVYLYGRVLEAKNLFPKAIEIYRKVGEPFSDKAKSRLAAIRIKAEDNPPAYILDIYEEAKSFLSEVKDEGACYLLVDEKIEITPDNTSVSTVHVIEQVIEERGKELAEVEVGYDSTYERVELEFARTITKDKKVLYAGAENIRDIGRYLNFPLYSNSRAFIVSMPSVEVGSIIEYKLKIYSSKLVNEDDFNFIYRLKESHPLFKAKFSLVVPKESQVNFKFFNKSYAKGINLKPKLTRSKDAEIYSWNFQKIKSIIPENGMPPISWINPAILISSFTSWDEIYKWWYSLYIDKATVTDEIANFVKELIEDTPDKLSKIKRIHEYVASNIRYVAIEYGDSGYEPHYAQEVFTNKYGDCKDQAILLVTMLKAAGIEAYPVLIPTRTAYPVSKDFPSINFNHAISAVRVDKKMIFMDPTAETTAFKNLPIADQNRLTLVFLDEGPRLINTGYIKDNVVTYTMDIDINEEENANITRSVATKGFFASGYRWYLKYTHPALIKENIQEKMLAISSLSKLKDYKIKDADNFDTTPMLTYHFGSEKFLNPAGNLRIVPVLNQLYLDHSLISKDEREYPIDFKGFYSKKAKIKLNLPNNLRVKYLPKSKVLENAWFKLNISYEGNSDIISCNQSFLIKRNFVSRKDYLKFRESLRNALYLLREEIILEKAK